MLVSAEGANLDLQRRRVELNYAVFVVSSERVKTEVTRSEVFSKRRTTF
jgi:hypothetical protein